MTDHQPDQIDGTLTGEIRPFASVLQEIRTGTLHSELSIALQDLVHAVRDTGKPGTLTLTVKVEPMKKNRNLLNVSDDVKTKLPQPDRDVSIYFADAAGNLTRNNPDQDALPGIVRAVPNSDTATTTTRKANDR